jgi:hypothetical protein
MNLDENSANSFDFSQGLRSIEVELSSEYYLCLKSDEALEKDWAGSTARLGVKEPEKERLTRLERELIDHLIEEYERVVEDGLPPQRAIASLLEWASRECPRLVP